LIEDIKAQDLKAIISDIKVLLDDFKKIKEVCKFGEEEMEGKPKKCSVCKASCAATCTVNPVCYLRCCNTRCKLFRCKCP